MSARSPFAFCLYVADDTPNSSEAVANLTAICEKYLHGRYTIEIVDVLKSAARAEKANVVMTPTLVRSAPPPGRRIVGNLRHTAAVLQAMGIETEGA